jgi:hypothetical protein
MKTNFDAEQTHSSVTSVSYHRSTVRMQNIATAQGFKINCMLFLA